MSDKKREEQIKEAARQRADQYDHPSQWSDTYYGFIDGAEWADSHPQWIPVEERLPEPHFADTSSNWVLVCTTKGGIFIDSYNHKHNEWCNNRTSITHWMPLPEAPRKED